MGVRCDVRLRCEKDCCWLIVFFTSSAMHRIFGRGDRNENTSSSRYHSTYRVRRYLLKEMKGLVRTHTQHTAFMT